MAISIPMSHGTHGESDGTTYKGLRLVGRLLPGEWFGEHSAQQLEAILTTPYIDMPNIDLIVSNGPAQTIDFLDFDPYAPIQAMMSKPVFRIRSVEGPNGLSPLLVVSQKPFPEYFDGGKLPNQGLDF